MSQPSVIRIIVADDHPIVRSGLRALLETLPDVEVIGEAENGRHAIDQAARHAPDVVIMDIQMPVVDGIQAVREIVNAHPQIGVLMLTMFEDDANVFAAVQAGARGYLLKGATPTEVANAIRAVHDGQVVFGAALAVRIASYFSTAPAAMRPGSNSDDAFSALTARENEILTHLAAGASNNAIARQLGISAKTVANHVSNILTKLQTADRAEAIIRARSAGLGT
ncbi:MAG TPA: response regulator transcription factor [Frankiaceae bacterium]|jgi:DNA-binding NarL/FixJ family response regulator|nr:response regulator transcription factor [Frankiaceae bacterium]